MVREIGVGEEAEVADAVVAHQDALAARGNRGRRRIEADLMRLDVMTQRADQFGQLLLELLCR